MLFACGNQRSFLTKDIVKRPQFKVFGIEELPLYTFAALEAQQYHLLRVRVNVQLLTGKCKKSYSNVIKKTTAKLSIRLENKERMSSLD